MENKKNKLFVFVFSMMPGAGEMYLGAMSKGILIMMAFFVIAFLGSMSGLGPVIMFLPVIWFYSFFDTHNLKQLTKEELKYSEERFLEKLKNLKFLDIKAPDKIKKIFGFVLIFFGAFMLLENFIEPVVYIVFESDILNALVRRIPTLAVAALIIWFGIRTINGSDYNENDEDFIEYKAEEDIRGHEEAEEEKAPEEIKTEE